MAKPTFAELNALAAEHGANSPHFTRAYEAYNEPERASGGRTEEVPDDEKLIGMHNTRADKLLKAHELGGYAVPSIALAKMKNGFHSFGDISLIAPPHLYDPKRNPVFASDAYSPRFPSLDDEGKRIFLGFTNMGNRRYRPLTLDNIVRAMKGKVRGEEGHNFGAGSVRAMVAPKFRSMDDIKKARNNIVTREEMDKLKEGTNQEILDLADKFQPHSRYFGTPMQHSFAFPDILAEVARKGVHTLKEHYKDTLPDEHVHAVRGLLNHLRDMPTEYFESKPQRGVGLNEFAGAIVPHDQMEQVRPVLEQHGISRIESYGGLGDREGRIAALRKFADQGFHQGGGVEDEKLQKAAGGAVDHHPTEAQKAAGNYAKERVNFQGLPISIENKKGSTRSGVDDRGKPWSVRVPADYGYIRGTRSADEDHMDCYVGPDDASRVVVVVNQCNHRDGKFDEHKCFLGFPSERAALHTYLKGFSDGRGPDRIGSVEVMSIDAFKHWLKHGRTTKKAHGPRIVDQALGLVRGTA